MNQVDTEEAQALMAIRKEGEEFKLPLTNRSYSLHILADARTEEWPTGDNICKIEYHPKWQFKNWVAALRSEIIRIECNTVVIYLEKIQDMDDVPPIKNGLHSICKVIRQHQHSARIFIANFLPQIH